MSHIVHMYRSGHSDKLSSRWCDDTSQNQPSSILRRLIGDAAGVIKTKKLPANAKLVHHHVSG
jgi:hypothetical protein